MKLSNRPSKNIPNDPRKRITVSIPESLLRRLEEKGKEVGESRNTVILVALRAGLENLAPPEL